jgi:Ala-tRNA(Pro) deacylase
VRARSLEEFLEQARVPFTAFQHPNGCGAQYAAALSHVPGRSWAKTVICVADDQLVAAVVPAHRLVDLERLRFLIGAAMLRLAQEAELTDLWPDGEPGATSPFSTRCAGRVFVDRSFVGEPEMVFCAGTHTDAIRMHYWDFAELVHPMVAEITVPLAPARQRIRRMRPTSAQYSAATRVNRASI